MNPDRRRLTHALLLSLLIHALLFSLTFGGEGLGLPGFGFPWRERRIVAPDLRVVLVPAQVTAAEPTVAPVAVPLPQASILLPLSGGPTQAPPEIPESSEHPKLILARTLEAFQPQSETKAEPEAKPMSSDKSEPAIATAVDPAPASKAPMPTERAADVAPPSIPVPEVIAALRPEEATFAVPAPSPPTPAIAVASSAEAVMPTPRDAVVVAQKQAEPEVRERAAEVAKVDPQREAQLQRQADQLEAARVEAVHREAARIEVARLAAAKQEAQRQEIARQEAVRVEAARVAATQLDAQRQEATRIETARLEAQRQATARLAVAKLEVARLETERQVAVGQPAALQEAARLQAEKEEDERRAARRQAMGRQLNEEAAKREAAANAPRVQSTLPYSYSTARRARLWGRTDPNVELVQYVEGWARRIQFNTPVETIREVMKRPHTNPMVTVAIRSDGSVESVTIVVSSGVAEVDEAIRRIAQEQAPNPVFPPGLARAYDVIEVRRTWHFDTAIRMY